MKLISRLLLFACVFALIPSTTFAQIHDGNAFLIGDFVNVGVDSTTGKEGTFGFDDFHSRSTGVGGITSGFVADVNHTDWDTTLFHGDFFIPGAPENGFGIRIDTINYSNNYTHNEIIVLPGYPTHSNDDGCISVEWRGIAEDVIVKVLYQLKTGALYYTTEVTLYNESLEDLTDLYYYRNVDADNNHSLGAGFITTNTLVSQPDETCQKALVSSTQSEPFPSYVGFGAIGPNFRVSAGGFLNRNGSDIWNGVDPYMTEEGEVAVADQAISLAYKTDLLIGDSTTFVFSVILSEEGINEAFNEHYNLNYLTSSGETGTEVDWDECTDFIEVVTLQICKGDSVLLFVEGDFIADYDWIWTPDEMLTEITGDSTYAIPTELTTYTVTTSISDCLGPGAQTIVIDPTLFPLASVSLDVTITEGESTTLIAEGGETYEWFPIIGLSDPTAAITDASPTETTFYSVVIGSDSVMCSDTLMVIVYVEPDGDVDTIGLNIDESILHPFKVYPNPFDAFTIIDFGIPLKTNHSLTIFDLLGKEIYRNEQVIGKIFKIENQQWESGMYLIYLTNSDSELLYSTKLMIE
ncbi:MAG: T9SS type A sorting domain-containing protein [Crocinitomix sp.]|nr:T9SS type A sorting domain-containing protein [Crocinitomix sp.]